MELPRSPSWHWIAGRPRWPFDVGAILSGPFVLSDYAAWASNNPDWAGPINLLPTLIRVVFFLSIVGLILVQFARSKTKENYRQLKARADRAQALENTVAENISEIMNGIISGFEAQLKLNSGDNSRISLYVNDQSDDLVSIGRVATNPNHRHIGRKILPKDKGCVGKAWAEGWAFVADFGTENYDAHVGHYGMTTDEIAVLAMKPRYLAALRIDDGPRSLAVLVFESQQANRFDEVNIKREMIAFTGYLVETLQTLAPHLPKPLAGDGQEL